MAHLAVDMVARGMMDALRGVMVGLSLLPPFVPENRPQEAPETVGESGLPAKLLKLPVLECPIQL